MFDVTLMGAGQCKTTVDMTSEIGLKITTLLPAISVFQCSRWGFVWLRCFTPFMNWGNFSNALH